MDDRLPVTARQMFYLRALSIKTGRFEKYEDLEKLSRRHARYKIWQYQEELKGKKV